MNSGVYLITNRRTGEQYVGMTTDMKRREHHHRSQIAGGYSPLPLIRQSFTPFREEDLEFRVLERCSGEDGNREMHWIKILKPALNRQTVRPEKPDKFDAFISLPCHKSLVEALEAYRAKHGITSRGEAARQIIAKATGGKP